MYLRLFGEGATLDSPPRRPQPFNPLPHIQQRPCEIPQIESPGRSRTPSASGVPSLTVLPALRPASIRSRRLSSSAIASLVACPTHRRSSARAARLSPRLRLCCVLCASLDHDARHPGGDKRDEGQRRTPSRGRRPPVRRRSSSTTSPYPTVVTDLQAHPGREPRSRESPAHRGLRITTAPAAAEEQERHRQTDGHGAGVRESVVPARSDEVRFPLPSRRILGVHASPVRPARHRFLASRRQSLSGAAARGFDRGCGAFDPGDDTAPGHVSSPG